MCLGSFHLGSFHAYRVEGPRIFFALDFGTSSTLGRNQVRDSARYSKSQGNWFFPVAHLKMRLKTFVGMFFVPAALCVKLPPDALQSRQDGCEVYGDYPEYTGPCEDTSESRGLESHHLTTNNLDADCGAKGTDCTETFQGCVIYPGELAVPTPHMSWILLLTGRMTCKHSVVRLKAVPARTTESPRCGKCG